MVFSVPKLTLRKLQALWKLEILTLLETCSELEVGITCVARMRAELWAVYGFRTSLVGFLVSPWSSSREALTHIIRTSSKSSTQGRQAESTKMGHKTFNVRNLDVMNSQVFS